MHVRIVSGAYQMKNGLYLNDSIARSKFKDLLGNANHLIITTLVGLHAVEANLVEEAPPELRAAWGPKDFKVSARRARRMALDTALIRATDAVDVYIRYARRAPSIIQNVGLRNDIDGAGRSIFRKVLAVQKVYGSHDPLLFAMVLVMVAWRNRGAHSEADVDIDDSVRQIIEENSGRLRADFRGLDAKEFLAGFEDGDPRFKEVASLIHASQMLVELLEAALFRDLNSEQFLKDLIWYVPRELTGVDADRLRKKSIQSVWGRDQSDRHTAVLARLRQNGLSTNKKMASEKRKKMRSPVEFDEDLITRLCSMSPSQVYAWAKPTEA